MTDFRIDPEEAFRLNEAYRAEVLMKLHRVDKKYVDAITLCAVIYLQTLDDGRTEEDQKLATHTAMTICGLLDTDPKLFTHDLLAVLQTMTSREFVTGLNRAVRFPGE